MPVFIPSEVEVSAFAVIPSEVEESAFPAVPQTLIDRTR
jgi:hypothetical protein